MPVRHDDHYEASRHPRAPSASPDNGRVIARSFNYKTARGSHRHPRLPNMSCRLSAIRRFDRHATKEKRTLQYQYQFDEQRTRTKASLRGFGEQSSSAGTVSPRSCTAASCVVPHHSLQYSTGAPRLTARWSSLQLRIHSVCTSTLHHDPATTCSPSSWL